MTRKAAADILFSGESALQGAIFDCDGTLLDSLGAWRGLEDAVFEESAGAVRVTEADRAHLVTFTVPETAAYLHERLGFLGSAREAEAFMDAYMVDWFTHAARLYPRVPEFLEECARAGVSMVVASSSRPAYLEAGLTAAGIRGHFKALVSVDDVGASKRDPRIFNHAWELLGTPRHATWVFEDSLYALQTARAAGFKTVALCEGETSGSADQMRAVADLAVGHFADLI